MNASDDAATVAPARLAADGSDGGICFFWTSGDRIFIVSAEQLSHERAIRLAAATR